MGKCRECKPCKEVKCLGCIHHHTTECIILEEGFGEKPIGTNLTETLSYIYTLLQESGADGVGVQSAVVNGAGHLIITLTSGEVIDAGLVKGANGIDGATGPAGPQGIAGIDGINGNDGATGADNMALLYKNLLDLSTATTGFWETVGSYVLPPFQVTNEDVIELDLVLSSATFVEGKFDSLFRLSFSTGEVLVSESPLTPHRELLGMRRTLITDRIAHYNLNIKIYVNGASPEYNISFTNNINNPTSMLPSSGFIKDDSSLSACNFALGTTFNFQLLNNAPHTAKIHSIIIKHIKK